MFAGISSASMYPLHTEDAVHELAKMGVRNAEIFINDISETEGEIFADIVKTVKDNQMNIVSVHPFSSPMESLFLFSDYDRRRDTLIDMYKRYFECMNTLGAKIFVLHGAILSTKCSDERYFERYSMLLDAAEEFGITVAQENICYCKSKDLDFLDSLRKNCGERTKFVLDIKQAIRTGISPFEIINCLGRDIVHVHISDNCENADCLPVGKGTFDFPKLVDELKKLDYNGALFIELYRHNYSEYSELYDGMKKIEEIIANYDKK